MILRRDKLRSALLSHAGWKSYPLRSAHQPEPAGNGAPGRHLFDVLAVLIQRCGTDAVQFASCQHRFQHVSGIHRAVGLSGADDQMQLIDEQNDFPSLFLTSSRTAFRRSSNSPRYFAPATRAPISREKMVLSFRLSGTSPLAIRWARPSTTAVLPTPGSPIRTGLFLSYGTGYGQRSEFRYHGR